MDASDQIVNEHGQQMVAEASGIVAKDIRDIIMQGEQFASREPAVGADLGTVIPLSDMRVGMKEALGYAQPELPRYGTGELVNSITAEIGELQAVIQPLALEKAEAMQFGAASGWLDEYGNPGGKTPARPFFGVSRRAVEGVEQMMERVGARMVAALGPLQLPPIQMTV
jgi:hypothetical protein